MEDERVGAIYRSMISSSVSRLWGSLFPRGLSRSPFLPVMVIAILVIGPFVGWRLHRLGRFHSIKSEIKGDQGVDLPRPGGMDPIVLTVPPQPGSQAPQFSSVLLLPGLGTSVLQITANLPGVGQTPLLAAPSVNDLVNGQNTSPTGFNDDHGALEFPWAGELSGPVSPVGNSIRIPWQGKQLDASTEASAHSGVAEGGILWTQSADSVVKGSPAGQTMTTVYHSLNGEDHWPSKSDVTVTAQLTADTLLLALNVKNTGDAAEPVGAGWHPRFALPAVNRSRAQVQLPSGTRMQINAQGLPTGRLEPVSASDRYIGKPALIGAGSLDETIVDAKVHPAETGITFLNLPAGYGLRLVPLSSSIKALRLVSPEDASYISLGAQTNMDDPLGHVWAPPLTGGMITLQPGETMEWKVKLQIFALPTP